MPCGSLRRLFIGRGIRRKNNRLVNQVMQADNFALNSLILHELPQLLLAVRAGSNTVIRARPADLFLLQSSARRGSIRPHLLDRDRSASTTTAKIAAAVRNHLDVIPAERLQNLARLVYDPAASRKVAGIVISYCFRDNLWIELDPTLFQRLPRVLQNADHRQRILAAAVSGIKVFGSPGGMSAFTHQDLLSLQTFCLSLHLLKGVLHHLVVIEEAVINGVVVA